MRTVYVYTDSQIYVYIYSIYISHPNLESEWQPIEFCVYTSVTNDVYFWLRRRHSGVHRSCVMM